MGKARITRHLKPLHGWRAFVGEVGVIILGVLIALGLGQIVTEISWRSDTRAARQAIGIELGESLGQATERIGYAPCVDRRIDALATIIDRAAVDRRLPPLGDIRSPPVRFFQSAIWDSTDNAQTTAHFSRVERNAYVHAYQYVRLLHIINREELAAWTRLYALVGPGRELSSAEAVDLRRAVGDARVASRSMVLDAVRLKQVIDAYDLPYDVAAKREFSDRPLSNKEICQAMDSSIPAHYGQAPFRTTLARARKSPIKRIGQ